MKSPTEISRYLARQWQQSRIRAECLLKPGSWPQSFKIGKPSARTFAQNPQGVQRHVEAWRQVHIGSIDWAPVSYRASLTPVSIPVQWNLYSPSEWVAAMKDSEIRREYAQLEHLVERVDSCFHALLVAQRTLWLKKTADEVIATAALANRLTPGCAKGRPLRLLAEHGVDTKFFERNATLLTKLLDERFEGEASEQGLATFLDAFDESSHWVLIAPLSPGLLPFKRLRLTTAQLEETGLPCARVLAVENEQCVHLLPELPDTIAVLGSGLDLQWLASLALSNASIGYWGDMDTWGLLMLARARRYRADITPLLMNRPLFDQYGPANAVIEPVRAQDTTPVGLDDIEADFYRYLLVQDCGRLEQEFLPRNEVREALVNWTV